MVELIIEGCNPHEKQGEEERKKMNKAKKNLKTQEELEISIRGKCIYSRLENFWVSEAENKVFDSLVYSSMLLSWVFLEIWLEKKIRKLCESVGGY